MSSAPKDLKFEASSAEEAVKRLREDLGPAAKIVSVRQVEGKGLARFLTAPRFEIVATLSDGAKVEAAPEASASNPVPARPLVRPSQSAPAVAAPTLRTLSSRAAAVAVQEGRLAHMLREAGFDAQLIRRFQDSTDWEKLEKGSVRSAMGDLLKRLKLDFEALPITPVTSKMAFIGQPGVGKTTALCKQLATEVFFAKRAAAVLKLDAGSPNADAALGAYCEALGVPLLHSIGEARPEAELLVDSAGVNLSDPEERSELKRRLDELGIATRIWVVNAAYDNLIIDRGLAIAEDLGATHTVYTHLDELSSTARLWPLVLFGGIPPLFASVGPTLSHDRADNLADVLLPKTFPEFLLK